ncbi:GNAT family N-acetyltransferase [Pseudomonas sp. KBW05]|uniref:GNAT family N-acetyltransferase n=1 Tax=Pseudomonas TaxID=286 RepID=UPI000F5A45C4|nr:GNAT family N-acetyltransferase [Pseudomonas sp. KBW05]RQO62215.1 N-acetyltransferase [Pseudomonas sp. KBW05]
MLKLKRISAKQEIRSAVLQERYYKGSSPKTHDYIALSNDAEAGLLIYEDWGTPVGFIFEIFVVSDFRKRGIGNWILSQAEVVAAELGNTRIRLDARTLDPEQMSHNDLATWYQSKGYVWNNSKVGTLEKAL